MIYGTPTVAIDDDQTDRIGIRTIVLSQLWQPKGGSSSPLQVLADIPAPPRMPGGVELIGRQTRRQGGAMRTSWTFTGVDGDGKSVTFKTRDNSPDFTFEPGFAQTRIELHPRFQSLLETYAGTVSDGVVTWPATLDKGGGGTGLGGESAGEKLNPMYGVKEFLQLEGTYHFRYATQSINGLGVGVGKIHKSGLPGVPPLYADRDWLKAPAVYERTGPVYVVTESYWLSGPGGWPRPVYGVGSFA
jgi:hypothetical protein